MSRASHCLRSRAALPVLAVLLVAAACTDTAPDGTAAPGATTVPDAPPSPPPPTITLPPAGADPAPGATSPPATTTASAEPVPSTIAPESATPAPPESPATAAGEPTEPETPDVGVESQPADAVLDELLAARPTSTPYVLPVASAARADWADTHSSYPASDIFVPGGCGEAVLSPVAGLLVEVRRVDSWDAGIDDPATRGGRSVTILGDDGVRYYLANLDVVHPALEFGTAVEPGRFIGIVGDSGRTSACHLGFGISPPCPDPEWSVRRGVVWPYPYLDAWQTGQQLSPAPEVTAWAAANPDACALAALAT